MLDRRNGYLLAWLLVLLAAHVVAFAAVWEFFVHTRHGQLLDTIAQTGHTIGRRRIDGLVDTVLNAVSVLSLAAATALIGFIALARRRIMLALATVLLIAGANVTTQLLKYGAGRPDLGVDSQAGMQANTLPSGHTTVAASVAVALVLVLPPRQRGLAALLGAGYAGLTGVATLSAGWHRPSDAVAGLLVVGGWAAATSIPLALARRSGSQARTRDAHPVAVATLALLGVALMVAATLSLTVTDQVLLTPAEELGRRRLFAAYAGSAAGIAGTACLVMALLLTSVHHVVARRAD